jgi:hypothetical protein
MGTAAMPLSQNRTIGAGRCPTYPIHNTGVGARAARTRRRRSAQTTSACSTAVLSTSQINDGQAKQGAAGGAISYGATSRAARAARTITSAAVCTTRQEARLHVTHSACLCRGTTGNTYKARTNQAQGWVRKWQYLRLRSALAGQSRVCLCRLDDYRKPSAQQTPTGRQQQYEVRLV